mmetsp:Transcript_31048/g.75719  ORF Transcript_31048/g.75719 Transcript_31048/m.75719 type:complete len:344 (-) Transcript_31048:1826-2857(-)
MTSFTARSSGSSRFATIGLIRAFVLFGSLFILYISPSIIASSVPFNVRFLLFFITPTIFFTFPSIAITPSSIIPSTARSSGSSTRLAPTIGLIRGIVLRFGSLIIFYISPPIAGRSPSSVGSSPPSVGGSFSFSIRLFSFCTTPTIFLIFQSRIASFTSCDSAGLAPITVSNGLVLAACLPGFVAAPSIITSSFSFSRFVMTIVFLLPFTTVAIYKLLYGICAGLVAQIIVLTFRLIIPAITTTSVPTTTTTTSVPTTPTTTTTTSVPTISAISAPVTASAASAPATVVAVLLAPVTVVSVVLAPPIPIFTLSLSPTVTGTRLATAIIMPSLAPAVIRIPNGL